MAEEKTVLTGRLTDKNVELMMRHVLRRIELYNIAKIRLKPTYFRANSEAREAPLRLLWRLFQELESKAGMSFVMERTADTKARLFEMINDVSASNSQQEPPAVADALIHTQGGKSVLDRIFDGQITDMAPGHGLLKRFLLERGVQDELHHKLAVSKDWAISDLPEILQRARDTQIAIDAADSDPVESGAPEGWEPVKLNKHETGVPFLDQFLRGGACGAEVYGILGAFGSGKTCLAVQLLAGGALSELAECDILNVSKPDVPHYPREYYYFPYEATREESRQRLWASQCFIHHEVLEDWDPTKLSSIENGYESLKPYEQKYWNKQKAEQAKKGGGTEVLVQGEKERLESMLPLLRRNLWIIDMSGVPENPKRGTGYVHEISAIVQADLLRKQQKSGRKHEVGAIIIDYAGIACRRYMAEHDIPYDQLRHYIGDFGMCCKRELAVKFNCPVWVFHQLSGESQKRTAVTQQHYSDAAESKSFAENLAFCLALGTKDDSNDTVLLTCSKARRAKVGPPMLLLIEGQFFRLVTADEYFYNTKTKRVEPKEVFKVTGGKTFEGAKPPGFDTPPPPPPTPETADNAETHEDAEEGDEGYDPPAGAL